jgi:murein DD-endopeptidase MepM/ murein hydrolase activator NlpD
MPADTIKMKKLLLVLFVVLLSACSTTSISATSTPTASSTATAAPTPSPTEVITTEPIQIQITPTPTQIPFSVCCPLEDETFESLPLIITKPLDIPPFGQDVGHHGVDFAYFSRGERDSIQGIEIYSVMSGSVVLTLEDTYPYGYAIMIETPLADLPESLQESLMAAYLPVPEDPNYRLNCPEVTPPILTGEYSVYHLYAHMEEQPAFKTGDLVSCGERLGTVGSTGWSSNPHLHLETRLGPSGANFQSMAHYLTSCTIEEISNYCLWRMSGYYQLFDPFILFDTAD